MGSQTEESVSTAAIAELVFVCPMEVRHIPQVCELEEICFASPWNERMFTDELEKNPLSRYVVLLDREKPGRVVAYAGYWKIFDEGHITNVAVRPEWRGKKAGTYLMNQLMQLAAAEGIGAMTLEVRKSNDVAQALYRKLGFREEGVRKKYYEDNGEDALIMWYRREDGEETD